MKQKHSPIWTTCRGQEGLRSIKGALHMIEVDHSAIAPVEADRGEVETARVGLKATVLHERVRGSHDALMLGRAGQR